MPDFSLLEPLAFRTEVEKLDDTNGLVRISETATGVWTGDAPARTPGEYPVEFFGWSDPADSVNGVATPANIQNEVDSWKRKSAP